MKRKRSSRQFFERHREQFERSDRAAREWLERFEARRKADRVAAERKPAESSETA